MDPDVEYNEIYLDSRDSITNNLQYPNTDWPLFYLTRPLYNIVAIKVLEAEIPFSYHVINNQNNTFLLTEPLVGSATITIPSGTYTATTLATTLASLLTTASPASRTYTVTFNTATQKFTFTTNFDTFVLTFGTTTDPGVTNPRWILGMNPGANASTGVTLVSPFSVQVSGPNYVYLNSDVFGVSFRTTVPQNYIAGGGKGPQICKIPINGSYNQICFYKDPAPEKWFSIENLQQVQSFDLYCTLGNSNQKIRFNGQNFSVKLGVYTKK
jgi:hypothetical protein